MPTISLCMIVKDEEKILERHLKHIKDHVDEIIIVDTGSKDKTVEIAKKYTNKVYHFKWCDDFSKARNFSLSKATKDWVLDADEFIEKPKKLKGVIAKHNADIYNFKQHICNINYKRMDDKKYLQNKLKKALVNDPSRLFRRSLGIFYEGIVHERATIKKGKTPITFKMNIRSLHLRDIHKVNSDWKYYYRLCEKEINKGNLDCNLIYNLLAYCVWDKDYRSFSKFFQKVPRFKIDKGMYPFMINLVRTLNKQKRKKEAKKLADVLYKNVPDKVHADVLRAILKEKK